MMSIFKKAAPEPPAKVEPKGSAYDLDIEADGDDPATAATVVNALYAKYKKNVRVADGPHARDARIQRARATIGHGVVRRTTTTALFRRSRPAAPAFPRPHAPRALSPRGFERLRALRAPGSAGNPRWRGRRPVSATTPGADVTIEIEIDRPRRAA